MAAPQDNRKVSYKDIEKYRGQLLGWYDAHRRDIPWRVRAGQVADPYHVWLSEIMCQQTTVQAVKAYYLKFLDLWPTVQDLSAAKQEDVMTAWAGLGYYARARNLHKCARIVANDMNGAFPDTQDELRKLPGIGEYTSAAIAAIAFNRPATVVDGNVERVIARFFAVEEPLPAAKKQLKNLAHNFYEGFEERPGDLAQAFMDLGAGICIPKSPRCVLCPLQKGCRGHEKDIARDLPYKTKNKNRPQKYGNLYWITNKQGRLLVQKRPQKGLLGGMIGLPTSEWETNTKQKHPDFIKSPKLCNATVNHTFTHFDLQLRLYRADIVNGAHLEENGMFWAVLEETEEKLPSVFKKAFKGFYVKS